MKKSRYTASQILSILKQNEAGAKVADLCREHGMSEATFCKWRSNDQETTRLTWRHMVHG